MSELPTASGALEGFRVVDASNYVFGPVATQILGDLGADVIKIEPPEGDPTRRVGKTRSPLMGSLFLNLNRNKRSVVLDLKTQAGLGQMLSLLETADVFVHNIRDAAVDKLGLSYRALSCRFPKLVYAEAKGFGSGGRYQGRPAFDDVIQGLAGVTAAVQAADGVPGYFPALFTDKLCGVYLSTAITTALLRRERTERGQRVSVPMLETVASFNLLDHLGDAALLPTHADEAELPLGYARVLGRTHRPLRTSDGYLCLVANTDAQWRQVFEEIGASQLLLDPRFSSFQVRMVNAIALYELVEAALSSKPTSFWLERFSTRDVPCGPTHDFAALRRDGHLDDVGFFQVVDHPSEKQWLTPKSPFDFSGTPASLRRGPPRLGEHTEEVLHG